MSERTRKFQERARKRGMPFCENGHGLVGWNVTDLGDCAECGAWMVVQDAPPASEWLDWAQVYQALQGWPLMRDLTLHETLCAIETVRRRMETGRGDACTWLRDNTFVEVPGDDGEYLYLRWAPKRNLRPVTVTGAMLRDHAEDLVDAEIAAADDDAASAAA